jgi:hypothetical protein
MAPHNDPGRTNHPCLRMGRHNWYQSITGVLHRIRQYFQNPMVRICLDARIRTMVLLTCGKLTWIYFLPLLSTV